MNTITLSSPISIVKPSSSSILNKRTNVVQRYATTTVATAKFSNIRSKLKVTENNRWSIAEKMNSRLAMLGYVCGSIRENISGDNYIEQFKDNYILVIATTLLVAYSTIVTKDVVVKEEERPFTTNIELLNGRMVMIGMLLKIVYDGSVYFNS